METSDTGADADLIVVGSGHNGLVAACYLAQAGLDVLVVEAHEKAGGMTATSPMAPEAPDHLINEASIQASLFRTTSIDSDLGLSARFGARMRLIDPAHVHMAPDGASLALWRDPQRTAEEIHYFSPKDASSYLDLCRTINAAVAIGLPFMQTSPTRPELRNVMAGLKAMAVGRKELRAIGSWIVPSHREILEERFEHDMIRAPLLAALPFMPFENDLGGWALIYLGVLHQHGVAMWEGGTGAFVQGLLDCLASYGGRVRTGAPVEQLTVSGGRVTGVVLAGGEELSARKGVLTACSPKTTLTRLLPAGVLPERLANRAAHIPTTTRGIADYKLDVALRGKITMPRHTRWRAEKFPANPVDLRLGANSFNSYQEGLEAARACVRGDIPEHAPGLGQVTTAFDPSMAPEGHDTFWFWSGITPSQPRDSWDVVRKTLTDRVIADANQYYEGIEEFEIGRRALVKVDIESRFWAIDGSVYHVDPIITRFGPMKPARGLAGYVTPVPGLFLTGSGTHPVAGMSGLPGHNAAKAMLRHFRKESKAGRAPSVC